MGNPVVGSEEDERSDLQITFDAIGSQIDSLYMRIKVLEMQLTDVCEVINNDRVSHKRDISNLHKLLGKDINEALVDKKKRSFKNVL